MRWSEKQKYTRIGEVEADIDSVSLEHVTGHVVKLLDVGGVEVQLVRLQVQQLSRALVETFPGRKELSLLLACVMMQSLMSLDVG